MDFRRQDDGGCRPCPFSEPGKGDARNPVYQNPPSISDPDCFTKSTEALLFSLDAASPGAPGDISLQVCKTLADLGDGKGIFHALYYLDKIYCGLGEAHSTGDDPNVNSILTTCSHYGISNLADPGWPSSSYHCAVCIPTTEQSVQTPSATTSPSVAPVTKAEATPQSLSPSSEAFSSTSRTILSSSPASITTPFPSSPTSTNDVSMSASLNYRIPTQGIAAITVCTTLAIAAAMILLFCVLRRRRKQLEASGGMDTRISMINNEHSSPRRDTYEPLISPSNSISGERPTLTPPPRLRDRRILPSLLRPLSRSEFHVFGPPFDVAHHSSSSLYSTTQTPGGAQHDIPTPKSPTAAPTVGGARTSFPWSPIYAPTANKMEPRPERMRTHGCTSTPPEPSASPSYTRLKSPPPVSFTFPPRTSLDTTSVSPPPPLPTARNDYHRRGTARHPYSSPSTSVSSGGAGSSGQDYHSTILSTVPSPIRPCRPHDTPLEIPDLVTPRSASPAPAPAPAPTAPPPTKSLPRPPPIGIARTTGMLPSPASSPRGDISLHSLAEQHRRERDSWGSWGDEEMETETAAGRMFGVSFPPAGGSGGGD